MGITWDVLIWSELVNIRLKANKHSYDLSASKKNLNEEIFFCQNSIRKDRNPLPFSDFSTEFWRNHSKSTFFNTERQSQAS